MQRAVEARLDELIDLWKRVFEDTDEFLVPFLKARKDITDVYFEERDGRIVATIWYIRTPALIKGERQDVMLISGVATDKAYRRQGIMASLIEESRQNYTVPLVLYPAVRSYYEANGFYSSSKATTYILPENKFSFQERYDTNLLNSIYSQSIRKNGGLLRDKYAWEDILSDNYLIYTDGAYALFSPEEGGIKEAAAADEKSAKALLPLLGGKVTAIPGCALDSILSSMEYPSSEKLLGMCSEDNGIYIAEQY